MQHAIAKVVLSKPFYAGIDNPVEDALADIMETLREHVKPGCHVEIVIRPNTDIGPADVGVNVSLEGSELSWTGVQS